MIWIIAGLLLIIIAIPLTLVILTAVGVIDSSQARSHQR